VVLTIAGDVGHVHDIQQRPSVGASNWQTVNSVTLTSDPQNFTLSRPATNNFWRVIAH
jgi:hypothetical protein